MPALIINIFIILKILIRLNFVQCSSCVRGVFILVIYLLLDKVNVTKYQQNMISIPQNQFQVDKLSIDPLLKMTQCNKCTKIQLFMH